MEDHKKEFLVLMIVAYSLMIVAYSYYFIDKLGIILGLITSISITIVVVLIVLRYVSKNEEGKEKEKIAVPKPPTPYYAHPYSTHENFTGRERERKELTEWLKSDSNPMFTYVAMGGMGKSALAWHWLREDVLKKENPLKGVIWWSFYDKEAEAGFESFLNHSIEYASEGNVDAKKLSTRDKMDLLYALLSENQFILVLDGIERLLRAYAGMGSPYQGDDVKEDEKKDYKACIEPNCGTFLQMLASVPKTKTLITTRIHPKELDNLAGVIAKELTQMDKDDAEKFFKRHGIEGTRVEIEEVCCAYGFYPLALRLIAGMIIKDMKYRSDIKAWAEYNPIPELKGKEGHNIFDLAYNSLYKKKQEFISKLSAFRNPMAYDAISIFNDFGSEKKFNDVLVELVDRGLLLRDNKRHKFDLHPIVRKYCYGRLNNKRSVHNKIIDYFAPQIPSQEKVKSMDDLAPVIELYHHTVRAGRYDDAFELFSDKLHDKLYYNFGAYQTVIELLRALFQDSGDKVPKLKSKFAQEWTLNSLANSYSRSGQPRNAVNNFQIAVNLAEKSDNKLNLAIDLGNLAYMAQIPIGELSTGESNLRRVIEISCEIKNDLREAVGRREFGLLLAYLGRFEESEKELIRAIELSKKLNDIERESIGWAYRSLRALFMSNAEESLKFAKKSRELANNQCYEGDIIHAEYLLGASYSMKENLSKAEEHLNKALIRDRKINLVELEPDILLELAKLRFKENRKEEALKLGEEALQIADRCEYRLNQADIHNFLANFYLDSGDLNKAKEHGRIAKERAKCEYKPALEVAEKLLKDIDSEDKRNIEDISASDSV